MKVSRSEKIRAGAFVLVSLFLLVMIFVLVAGLRVFKSTKTLVVRFSESVTGLEVSSIVRYQGVPVGRVARIGFAKDAFPRIDVTIEVDPDAPVRENTSAALKPQGITGLYYIDLDGGSPDSPLLEEGGRIVAGKSITFQVLQTLSDVGVLVKDVGTIVRSLNTVIQANEDQIGDALEEMTGAARDSRAFLKQMMEFLDDTKSNLNSAIASAGTAMDAVGTFAAHEEFQSIPKRLTSVLDKVDTLAARLNQQIETADVSGTLTSIQSLVKRVETLENEVVGAVREFRRSITANSGLLTRTLADLKQFSLNMKMLSREVRDQPSRLFFDTPRGAGRRKQ